MSGLVGEAASGVARECHHLTQDRVQRREQRRWRGERHVRVEFAEPVAESSAVLFWMQFMRFYAFSMFVEHTPAKARKHAHLGLHVFI